MIAIEIFAGAGALAAGFRKAGIEFAWSLDNDPNACATYEANLGRRPVQLEVRDLLEVVKLGFRLPGLHLLVADPPCTPYSRAGKKKTTGDPRDRLLEVIELIRLLRPAAYLVGNLPGLEDAPNLGLVQRTFGSLIREGYCVADFANLDAASYGVPQKRSRPYWFGHQHGIPCLSWPLPTHGDPKDDAVASPLPGMPSLRPWVTCRDALGHLPAELIGRPVHANRSKSQDMRLGDPEIPASVVTGKSSRVGVGAGHVFTWPWDRPATTVCVGDTMANFGRNGRAGDPQRGDPNAIVLSETAGAILQGFPEGWKFYGGTKKSRWSQIGQAVPIAVAEAIGRSVMKALLRGFGPQIEEAAASHLVHTPL